MMSNEQDDVIAIASAWQKIAAEARPIGEDSLGRFMALWVGFNALYALKFDALPQDHAQVREFAKWPPAMSVHRQALENPEGVYLNAVRTLAENGVYNFRKARWENIAQEADLSQVMELVYHVRCNLFHGRKVPAELRDRGLIRAAHVVVSELMATLMNRGAFKKCAA